jgi:hypothetical protein
MPFTDPGANLIRSSAMKGVSSLEGRRTALVALVVIPVLFGAPSWGQTSRPARPKGAAVTGAAEVEESDGKTPRPKNFEYGAYNVLLSRYVKNGLIDYAAWKKDGTAELDRVLKAMAEYPYPRVLSREERLSFLVNAYNAYVLRSILDVYPVGSVKDVSGFFDARKHALSGGVYTLDDIEKTLIHPNFSDFSKYHFLLVCGARGCPPFPARAVRGDSLVVQSGANLHAFVADSTKVQFAEADNVLHVSELFRWYRADFEKGDQTIPLFLAPHFSLGVAMKLAREEPRMEYIPFDWKLNDVEHSGGGQ